MDSAPTPVRPQMFLSALRAAVARFETASRASDSDATFVALFEALSWTVSLDERLGCGSEPELLGLRYARNAVHHLWADALELTQGRSLPTGLPTMLAEWSWRATLPEPRTKRGRAEYVSHLAGRPARMTLDAIVTALSARLAA